MIKLNMPTLQSAIMSDTLNKSTMEIFTVKEWEEKFDELFERVENGERIGIVGDNGHAAVMMPIDDELYKIYVENNQEAS